MENITELKDWDIESSSVRNVNLPQFSNFGASKNVNSLPFINRYLSKKIHCLPLIENVHFPSANKSSDFPSTTESNGFPSTTESSSFLSSTESSSFPSTNESSNFSSAIKSSGFPSTTKSNGFLPAVKNNNDDQHTLKNKGPVFLSKKLNIQPVSKRKNCLKLKKTNITKSKKTITPQMKKFISSVTDRNILKSVKTYARKRESISLETCDTLNCNTDKSTTSLSSEVTNSDRFHVVKEKGTSPLKHTNGYVGLENNTTNELSTNVKHCLFNDILFSECNSNFIEFSNKVESADSFIKEHATSECKNGYQRTRKNLKVHLGEKKKAGHNIEPTPTVKKTKAVKTTSKVKSKISLQKVNSRRKCNRVSTVSTTVCNKTDLPITLQENSLLNKEQVPNSKAVARVYPTIRKTKRFISSSDSSTHMETFFNGRGKGKNASSSLENSYSENLNEIKEKNIFSNRKSVHKQSSNKGSKREIKFFTPRRKVSEADDLAKTLNLSNQLEEAHHLQSKDIAQKSSICNFENHVLDCSEPKTNFSKITQNRKKISASISIAEMAKELSFNSLHHLNKAHHFLSKKSSPKSATIIFEKKAFDYPEPKPNFSKSQNRKQISPSISIAEMAKELSFNSLHHLKEAQRFQSKKSAPKLATSVFEKKALDYPESKTNFSKKSQNRKQISPSISIAEMAKELSFNSPNHLKETQYLKSKYRSPISATSDFEKKVSDCPESKKISSKKSCNRKPIFPNVSMSNMAREISFNSLDLSLTAASDFENVVKHTTEPVSSRRCNLKSNKVNNIISPSLQENDPFNKSIDNKSSSNSLKGHCNDTNKDGELNVEALILSRQDNINLLKAVEEELYEYSYENVSSTNFTPSLQRHQPVGPCVVPHFCSKSKLLHLPCLVCDCNNANFSTIGNKNLLSLQEEINNYTSTVLSINKKNPRKVKSLVTESALNKMYKRIKKLFFLDDSESNCVSSETHLTETNDSTSDNELCKSSLDAVCNEELESNLRMQSRALNCTMEPKHDSQNCSGAFDFNFNKSNSKQKGASDFGCDLDSETKFQNQSKIFIRNFFNQINVIQDKCITKLMNDYVGDCDIFQFVYSVRDFCDDPQTNEVMSKCFSEIEKFSVPSSTVKLQYEFPVNFQDLRFHTVIKSYIDYFRYKIFPLYCGTITNQSVLNFANGNMSAFEISAVSCFFDEVELLTAADFMLRFTCVAVVVVYKEYQRRKESIII